MEPLVLFSTFFFGGRARDTSNNVATSGFSFKLSRMSSSCFLQSLRLFNKKQHSKHKEERSKRERKRERELEIELRIF